MAKEKMVPGTRKRPAALASLNAERSSRKDITLTNQI
jgi:hypothetical protein